ncbi:TetR/AcrR family transcriptional regulator [Natronococcus occultus]|uniref:Transcriptional regulator n=1 Tax=Natronococcus occultus SP4 TaxID=694430 RepID=L0K4A7_9EURY|nr:TetR/AcrR family transcriptional regulator [Natronococcus occultus]AGB39841.1 transcriptional regulator [Natronococcus occultus SP4]
MSNSDQFVAEQTDTVDVIMQSTYCVLQEHGYANLSIAKIADEAELSKSALYNHYDGKNELLLDFLSRFLDWFLESLSDGETQDPQEDLMRLIDLFSIDPGAESNSIGGVLDETAIDAFIELRAQAIHDEAFRRELLREDEAIHDRIVQIIRRGIADGVFRDVDPDSVAEFILTVLEGALFRYSLMNDATARDVYDQLDEYIDAQLKKRSLE